MRGQGVEHALAMDVEAMRRAGYATVDALVARLANPQEVALAREQPVADADPDQHGRPAAERLR